MTTFARIQPRPTELPVGISGRPSTYLVGKDLAEAANVALFLERPLLVTGEPGTGKTELAFALASQLDLGAPLEFHCKSSSVGRDVLYQFDHLRRLYDAQHPTTSNHSADQYVNYAALGQAIRSERPRLVLIDEIDKAPRDFPNDLLHEIARSRFSVPEVGPDCHFEAVHAPVVVITSNSERQLPQPFLRRCAYYHIPYPDREQLAAIVALHTRELSLSPRFVELVIDRFQHIREIARLVKKPSTDELIAWTRVLAELDIPEQRLSDASLHELPALPAVIKTQDDLLRLEKR